MTTAVASRTGELGAWVAGLSLDDVPGDVVERAKLHVLDTVGVMAAAAGQPLVESLHARLCETDCSDEVHVLGHSRGLSAANAALVNGLMAHTLDFDDTHPGSVVHASCVLVPTVLAAGQAARASGPELVAALVAGYELTARLGLAAGGGRFSRQGYHPTSLLGVFGAAAVAGRLFGLDAETLAHALGIAASQAGGLQQFSDGAEHGSKIKGLHPGWAAHAGLYAAIIASSGMTAPARVLEGRYSLYRTHLSEEPESPHRILAGLGEVWETRRLCPKEYPCCAGNQAYMDAALELVRANGLALDEIRALRCYVDELTAILECRPLEVKRRPATAYGGKFSLPFCVSLALHRDGAGVEDFSEEAIRDPEILGLCDRIDYEVDEEWNADHTRAGGWVRIETADGRTLEHKIPFNKGSEENPFTPEEYVGKFVRAATPRLGEPAVDALRAGILALDSEPAPWDALAALRG